MLDQEILDLTHTTTYDIPFPHFSSKSVLIGDLENKIYDWFQSTLEWNLVKTEFYEQYEFSLFNVRLPDNVGCLTQPLFLNAIKEKFSECFNVSNFELVDVVAHKLVNSQRIAVHNDYINGCETHRFIMHFNPYWQDEHGGYLLLFNSSNVSDISKIICPVNNSAFGFEISRSSHHAVSQIHNFNRYTIVYTFKNIEE